jgi:hypothetical protein
LFHQLEQVRKRVVVSTALLFGELMRPFVKLRSHLGGFVRRTAEGNKDLGELGNFHGMI